MQAWRRAASILECEASREGVIVTQDKGSDPHAVRHGTDLAVDGISLAADWTYREAKADRTFLVVACAKRESISGDKRCDAGCGAGARWGATHGARRVEVGDACSGWLPMGAGGEWRAVRIQFLDKGDEIDRTVESDTRDIGAQLSTGCLPQERANLKYALACVQWELSAQLEAEAGGISKGVEEPAPGERDRNRAEFTCFQHGLAKGVGWTTAHGSGDDTSLPKANAHRDSAEYGVKQEFLLTVIDSARYQPALDKSDGDAEGGVTAGVEVAVGMDENDTSMAGGVFRLSEEGPKKIAMPARFSANQRTQMVVAGGKVVLLLAYGPTVQWWTSSDDDAGGLAVMVIPDVQHVACITKHSVSLLSYVNNRSLSQDILR